eukprot:TRINITY_DN13289_c0_g1_i1.p1 TRINITY_DN13289_c0_g1~~TRINITY_DN13289_c0_g1_i1.p1  ORF type:complete len:595 (+),score=155.74 TRINITY_DN13289_c0_g1_i1:72-1787(+)
MAPEAAGRVSLFSERPPRPEEAGMDAEVLREADAALHKRIDAGELPGTVSIVVRNGVLAHMDCYGYADLERRLPMRPDSIVRLYSMSKCVVSVAVGILMEEGKLALEDPVAKFIPAFASPMVKHGDSELVPAERPMTLLQLLTHTAGIGYGPMLGDEPDGEEESRFEPLIRRAGLGRTDPTNPDAITSLAQWCDELAKIPLLRQPGTAWVYSYSHDVVGRIVEIASGERLDVFLRDRIFRPLGMNDTGFEIEPEKWCRTAGMYRRHDKDPAEDGTPRYEFERLDDVRDGRNQWLVGNTSPILAGGGSVDAMTGGLVSTAADYTRFCLMMLRRGELDGVRVLREATVDLFTSNMLPRATGSNDVWAFDTAGVGFCIVGSVSVEHPDLDEALRAGEYGWGGMAGTAWTNDPKEGFLLLSFSLVAFDLTTEEELRAAVRSSIERFKKRQAEEKKRQALQRRQLREKQRMAKLLRMRSGEKLALKQQADSLPESPVRPKRLIATPHRRSSSGDLSASSASKNSRLPRSPGSSSGDGSPSRHRLGVKRGRVLRTIAKRSAALNVAVAASSLVATAA